MSHVNLSPLPDLHPVWVPELISRYDSAGPRYTSYPTAVDFRTLEGNDILQHAAASIRAEAPLSLYFHIPFCEHVCYYCACNKVITRQHQRVRSYLDKLYQEIAFYAERFAEGRVVEQLHFGGGTPTFLSDTELQEVMAVIRRHFTLRDDDKADYSIEIDPRTVTGDTLKVLRDLGFNRLSFGIQDTNPAVQAAVNRVQPLEQVAELLQQARQLGFRSINFDLIYGLPLQTPDSFAETLETVIALSPDRLSVFNYAHLPDRFRPQRHIRAEDLPTPQMKLSILQHCIERLDQAGYQYIGMDHFAKPDDELAMAQREGKLHRNFQGYTTRGDCELLAMGASSISQVGDTYFQNMHDVGQWSDALDSQGNAICKGIQLSYDDRVRRALITQLICHFQLDTATFSTTWQINFNEYFAKELNALGGHINDGLISISAGSLTILPPGRLLIRSICMLFDSYRQAQIEQRFSRII
ncbi:oxygen-independent coproporphyrinogen III oxidase [Pokkaliibacter sp. MBI-7]|uniref:oxygen-independent coproporphyrinogen III oxidase n=1 Tax=Pokkaliibacter sp. MBI-7 TaxID=3040600 RepID=UPI0024490D85|nr:oxygen-independent coproporphyrinogen III oxidase [Pokkaliibacter sp. MBI-7]MDH2435107.1 oxygen-independent coproporphyrinogen III oxidase [Pokkaliibacter sp. MBI-7]